MGQLGMPEQAPRRRLAAILAADVVGYSRMMQADEASTLAALKARRAEILQPLVARYHGRIVKLMGDGALIEFSSAVEAVQCAVDLQQGMAAANDGLPEDRQVLLRLGINLGDVMVEDGDLYGDGVNIAARLEPLAEPGGIIISETVYNHVLGKISNQFADLGDQTLKNIAGPVRVYGMMANKGTPPVERQRDVRKPSIAVLPFTNMSGDPEQEYFSDGITEDIITDLSKVSALSVLSRNTTFAFKGKAADIGRIARQLKVGHVVEGSARKAGGRVRITAQLIDATKDSPVWAERYDRDLKDIFALQDEISQAIVAALKEQLLPEEKRAIETRSTQSAEAYQLYLLARYYRTQYGPRTQKIAHRFCLRALEIDPNYAGAWALAAYCETILYLWGKRHESGLSAAEKALSLDPTLADAHAAKAQALHQLGRNVEAIAAHEESLRLDPDSYDVRVSFAFTCMRLGRCKEAIEHYERAAQLFEADYTCLSLAAQCHRELGRHEECKSVARRALMRVEKEIAVRPDNGHAMTIGAIVLANLGETERAKEWALRAMTIESEDEWDNYELACAFALVNEVDRALDYLERYADEMPPERINWVKRDPDLTRLHDHPRFQALVERSEAKLAAVQSEHEAKVG
jgi:adenylate cyclase